MKLITQCDDDVLFLKNVYYSADSVKTLFEKVGVKEIRKRVPSFEGNETKEEIQEANAKQAVENILEMAEGFLIDYPEETIELLHKMIVLEEGEEYPHGVKLFKVLTDVLTDKDIVDFFQSCLKLAQEITAI